MFFFSLVIHLGPKCLARVACDLNLVMISSLASKWQVLKVGMPVFQLFYEIGDHGQIPVQKPRFLWLF